MIISVEQTASRFKQTFSIYHNSDWVYDGRLGNWNGYQDIVLDKNQETVSVASSKKAPWTHYIPFRHWFGKESRRKIFEIENENTGFFLSRHGIFKSFYIITVKGRTLIAYDRSIGGYDYVSIYLQNLDGNEEQIALIETHMTAVNNQYVHKAYLLDAYEAYKDILSLFVLYYSNFRFARQNRGNYGIHVEKSWTLSPYNDKYDPQWKETHFPEKGLFEST